jgi:hypothetical protein
MASKSIQILVNEISGFGTVWLAQAIAARNAVIPSAGEGPMKLLSRKEICVTQSSYERSFTSFRMTTGAG